MPATHIAEITDVMIADRLTAVDYCGVEWTGSMPRDAEQWSVRARWIFDTGVSVADVRAMLANDLDLDTANDEIDCAIAMACEPGGLPENAAVVIR